MGKLDSTCAAPHHAGFTTGGGCTPAVRGRPSCAPQRGSCPSHGATPAPAPTAPAPTTANGGPRPGGCAEVGRGRRVASNGPAMPLTYFRRCDRGRAGICWEGDKRRSGGGGGRGEG
jgi:hypothetical protein